MPLWSFLRLRLLSVAVKLSVRRNVILAALAPAFRIWLRVLWRQALLKVLAAFRIWPRLLLII